MAKALPRGGQMFNSTVDSLKQSLEALSADMAAHGMSFNLTSVAANDFTSAMNEEADLPQYSCVKKATSKKPIPFIFEKPTGFQGYIDPVFPCPKKYQSRYYPNSNLKDSDFTKEKNYLINSLFRVYIDNSNPTPDYQIICSNDIYNILKAHNVPTLMYIDCNIKHGLSPQDTITGFCPSDFGVAGDLTTDKVNEYLASRAAFFFQPIMNGTAGSLGGYEI